MARYLKSKIKTLLLESDTATLPIIKGRKLEELVLYLFESIPYVSFHKANVLDGFRAHELDVTFINDRKSEISFLDFTLITECKNTTKPTSSSQVGWFVRKLQDRGLSTGVLISLSGITGEAEEISSAYSEIFTALVRDKIKILVITRDEILSLSNTIDLVNLLKTKMLSLVIERTII